MQQTTKTLLWFWNSDQEEFWQTLETDGELSESLGKCEPGRVHGDRERQILQSRRWRSQIDAEKKSFVCDDPHFVVAAHQLYDLVAITNLDAMFLGKMTRRIYPGVQLTSVVGSPELVEMRERQISDPSPMWGCRQGLDLLGWQCDGTELLGAHQKCDVVVDERNWLLRHFIKESSANDGDLAQIRSETSFIGTGIDLPWA